MSSKVAAAVGVVITGIFLSTIGTYLAGYFHFDENLDIPPSLEEFKKNPKIIHWYFPGVDLNFEGSEEWASNKPKFDFLGSDGYWVDGRLVVNWERYECGENESNKWTGRIRWLLTFVNGDKGIILYASATAPSTSGENKLDAKGVIYAVTLDKTGDKKTWKIKHHKNSTADLKIETAKDKLPEAGEKLSGSFRVKDHWGFIDDTTHKLENLCALDTTKSQEETNKQPKDFFRGSWTWEHAKYISVSRGRYIPVKGKFMDWSKDGHSWMETFFGTLDPKLETLFQNFLGYWRFHYFKNRWLGFS